MAIKPIEVATQGLIRVANASPTLTIATQGFIRVTLVAAAKQLIRGFTKNVGRMMNP